MLAMSWEEDGVEPKLRSAKSMRMSLPPVADGIAPAPVEVLVRDCAVAESEADAVATFDAVVGDVEVVGAVSEK